MRAKFKRTQPTKEEWEVLLTKASDNWRNDKTSFEKLMRDSMIITHSHHDPNRRVFKINVGEMNPDEALEYANKMKQSFNKKPIINPETGEIDLRYNKVPIDQDFFLPSPNFEEE